MSISHFYSLLHKYVPIEPRKMGMEQIGQVLCAGAAKALYCQRDECMRPMFPWGLVDIEVFVEYVNDATSN